MTSTKFLMYSFKGGAGRTVSTANIAYILAAEVGAKVVLVDIDVESAGSSVIFDIDEQLDGGRYWSVQDVLRGYFEASREEGDAGRRESIQLQRSRREFEEDLWPRLHHRVTGRADGYLDVIPARTLLESSYEAELPSQEGEGRFGHLLRKIDTLESAPDIVLLDSASGLQPAALMGLRHCHYLVLFVRWSRQFVVGTTKFLKKYVLSRDFAPRISKVLLVPTAVPRLRPAGKLEEELKKRQAKLADAVALVNRDAAHHFGKRVPWVVITEGITECDGLKWDDRILVREDSDYLANPSAQQALRDYRRLAADIAVLANQTGDSDE